MLGFTKNFGGAAWRVRCDVHDTRYPMNLTFVLETLVVITEIFVCYLLRHTSTQSHYLSFGTSNKREEDKHSSV